MTDNTAGTGDSPAPRAQTMSAQGVLNVVVRGLLCTPLLCRGIGKRLIILYLTGRKSGRHYTIPVAYTRHHDILLIGTPFPWGRNLRTGEPVEIRLKGRRRIADVDVLTSEADVTAAYDVIVRSNRNFAKFNNIGLDPDGTPSLDDLHRAWTAGARAFRLTPR